MKPGDIVLSRFPHADLKIGKLRPALVIAVAPVRHEDVLLAQIEIQLPPRRYLINPVPDNNARTRS